MNATLKDYLMLHFIVLIWGFTAILGALISLQSLELVFYRTLIAAIGIAVLFYFRKKSLAMSRHDMLKVLGVGVVIALHWILFFWSAQVSTVSVCLAGLATTSLWTAFIDPFFKKTKIKWYEVALGVIVISGLVVIFSFETGYWLGISMALGSAFLGAVFSVLNSTLAHKHNPYQITFYEMIGACLFTILFMPIYAYYLSADGLNMSLEGYDWLWLLILGGVCTVYAFSVSVELMKRLTVFTINLSVNLEPVYGIILAVLIFGDSEKMTPQFYLGTAIILVSVLSYPILNFINKRRKPVRPLG